MNVSRERLLPVTGQVIIVEDDATLCALMVEALFELGVNSVAFRTTDAALTYMLEAHGNCPMVIADYGPPEQIHGAEFIYMVRAKWPSIASILTYGYELDPEVVLPRTTFLKKPWSLVELENAIANLLQPGHSFHQG